MLEELVRSLSGSAASPEVLRCSGLAESDLQLIAQDVLQGRGDIELTVLAKPADVRVVLFDRGAGADELRQAATEIADRIGEPCYSRDGSSLAEVVLARARAAGWTIATAESCTGGLVAGAITAVPGSSDVFVGGAVTYSNEMKTTLIGVDPALVETLGAVSDAVAMSMAAGVRHVTDADLAVAVTGIAGPDGGTAEKPVGTVWFGIAGPEGCYAEMRRFPGDREGVRERAVTTALDLLRRAISASS
jgi:nicotinamide-nucleotide amidase